MLVAAFASVKMLLSGTAPLTRGAALPMTAAALLQGVSIFVTPSTTGAALRPELLALRMLPSVLIAVGPRIHELQTRDNPRNFRRRRGRPYSVLPYFAVAVTFLVLLLVLPHERRAAGVGRGGRGGADHRDRRGAPVADVPRQRRS